MNNVKFEQMHYDDMLGALSLYNGGYYWECHDVLEEWWLENAHHPVRYIAWAIIQVAASLYHLENGNHSGASGMIEKAKKKIIVCENSAVESDFLEKKLSWSRFKKLVMSIPRNAGGEFYNDLLLFRFPK